MFWAWADDNVHRAFLGMTTLRTTFGWQLRSPLAARGQSARHLELADAGQRRGDDAAGRGHGDRGRPPDLRPGSRRASARGEADDEIDRQAAHLGEDQAGDASELVLGPGKRCRCDGADATDIVRWPDRYEEPSAAPSCSTG